MIWFFIGIELGLLSQCLFNEHYDWIRDLILFGLGFVATLIIVIFMAGYRLPEPEYVYNSLSVFGNKYDCRMIKEGK